MFFRHRYNCVYRDLKSYADPGVMVSYVMRSGERSEPMRWLGSVERTLVRHLMGVEQVILDIEGWRANDLDATQWLPAGEYVVGGLLPEGLFVVTDGGRPMIKRTKDGRDGKPDRLGRSYREV